MFWHPAIERLRLIVPQMSLWGYCQECFLYNTLSSSGRPKGGILCGLHHQEKLSSAFLPTASLLLTWHSPITYSLLLVTVYFTMSLFGLLWNRESHFGTVNCNSTRYYGLHMIVSLVYFALIFTPTFSFQSLLELNNPSHFLFHSFILWAH